MRSTVPLASEAGRKPGCLDDRTGTRVAALAVRPFGEGSAFLDGPLEGEGAAPGPSGGQKSGDGRTIRHGIPLPTLSVLKFHYQARIVAYRVGVPPQND